jgi:2,4-dienoyl-CoA reductase-like NADH-dependent reductase (Old Yellow Enzyme family)/thioredoxin reductase
MVRMQPFKNLFSPGRIGSLEIKNRIVMNAMGTLLEDKDGSVGDRLIGYYEARAKGGAGLIVTCHTRVVPHPRYARGEGWMGIAIWDDKFLPGWKELANRVHRHHSRMFIQLGHDGRQGLSLGKNGQPERVAPSAIACPYIRETPRELSLEEIEEIKEKFVEAAVRTREAGLDGISLHAAHGYLLGQFISPSANKRTDKYGGSLQNRLRFILEIISAIRGKVGRDYPVIIRMNGFEIVPDGLTLEDAKVIAPLLVQAGVDAIDVSAGTYAHMELVIPPTEMRPGFNIVGAEAVKKVVPVPVVVNGRINDPLMAEQILVDGRADFVGMSRAFLADPEWPKKAETGNLEDIRRCTGCCQGCLHPDGIFGGNPISCVINPEVGRERQMEWVPALRSKKVIVVGGGPAGLEAARVAALRGHKITLFEKTKKLGGQFSVSAHAPFRQDNAMAISWLARQVEKNGVKVELGREATAEVLKELNPDVVIIASGSVPLFPNCLGVEKSNVVAAVDVLSGKAKVSGKVVIIGGGLAGCETADFLGERGIKVTVVEMLSEIAFDCPVTSKGLLLARLSEYGVKVITSASLKEIIGDGVVITRNGKEEAINGVDYVILAMGMKPVETLSNQIENKVAEVYIIGDAKEPRKVTHAILEGAEIGRRI